MKPTAFKDYIYCRRRSDLKFAKELNRDDDIWYARPTWVTTERCSSTTCVPCDKVLAEPELDGCFVAKGPLHDSSFKLHTVSSSNMLYSAVKIKMKCLKDEPFKLILNSAAHKLMPLVNGNLSLFFNGEEKYHAQDSDELKQVKFPLQGVKGENEIMVVFKRQDLKATASGSFTLNLFDTASEFTQCEDTKVCLGKADGLGLATDWKKEAAKDLRESIYLQALCLKDYGLPFPSTDTASISKHGHDRHAPICQKWERCLRSSGKLNRIMQILEASGVHSQVHTHICCVNIILYKHGQAYEHVSTHV